MEDELQQVRVAGLRSLPSLMERWRMSFDSCELWGLCTSAYEANSHFSSAADASPGRGECAQACPWCACRTRVCNVQVSAHRLTL
eukprot:scaffold115489_cov20-Tisochrysis_lutea.AAC.1